MSSDESSLSRVWGLCPQTLTVLRPSKPNSRLDREYPAPCLMNQGQSCTCEKQDGVDKQGGLALGWAHVCALAWSGEQGLWLWLRHSNQDETAATVMVSVWARVALPTMGGAGARTAQHALSLSWGRLQRRSEYGAWSRSKRSRPPLLA